MPTAGTSGKLSVAVTLLVLAAVATATTDQYEQQSDTRLPVLHAAVHRFGIAQQQQQQDLQVGCADGAVNTKSTQHDPSIQVLKNWLRTRRKREADQRSKRDYIHWIGTSTSYSRQPQPQIVQGYQIHTSVPYWVPVWGNPRRIPVFFPPKPILFNPGYPSKNRPSNNNNKTPEKEIPVTIGSRINVNEAGEPIWGIVEPDPPAAAAPPPPSVSSSRPTKRPTPPLFHRPSLAERDVLSSSQSQQAPAQQVIPVQSPPQQSRPQQSRPQQSRPQQSRPLSQSTTREEPNRCVWSIISCCPASEKVRYRCFEQLGCPGAFWDSNPCSEEIKAAALNAAQRFYDQS